ncbi:Mpo1 family 2-hydroxy fatty acid dioxygenase [Variovorax paradoxus]|uniref:Mpo1 family 2-hydroxy fatty acid dioxygenase n=1 Tax=Variovorax paradoxus TaxID=34073 RepID=UPI0029C7CB90|nr:Mpo1-like protein [Variovorax paradoxus]
MMHTADAPLAAGERKVDRLLAHYGESHRHPTNELIHFAAIPAIMLSLVGLLFALHPWAAYLFVAASLVYYALLRSSAFLLAMLAGTALVLALVHAMGSLVLPVSAATFVVAWIFQFIGHRIEGRKPSFFEDIQYLWVGPLFVLSKLFLRLGIRW